VSLFVIPFWISFVVQVYAVLPWVRRDGYVGMVLDRIGLGSLADWIFKAVGLGSPGIVVPVLIYIWLPFMILPLFTAILRIDPALIEAAQDLGAGSWKTFWNVVVPLSYNGILTGTILVFITAFGSFVEPKILAGSSGLLIGNYIQASFLEFGKLPDGAAHPSSCSSRRSPSCTCTSHTRKPRRPVSPARAWSRESSGVRGAASRHSWRSSRPLGRKGMPAKHSENRVPRGQFG